MTSSLVGSEMCIRDRYQGTAVGCVGAPVSAGTSNVHRDDFAPGWCGPVSYTHLTLPTICSV
eukprot:6224258-Prorocentrum_lima.AAC.1